jgi:hypothetical protein
MPTDRMLLEANITWYLLPLAAAISLVYNASRYEHPQRIVQRSVKTFLTILFFMALILGVLMVLSRGL